MKYVNGDTYRRATLRRNIGETAERNLYTHATGGKWKDFSGV